MSIAETTATVQFGQALRTVARKAVQAYPGEQARIDRGLVIALNGGVELLANGLALVRSQQDAEVVYEVNGRCDCPDYPKAVDGRCKHRYAKALVKAAQRLLVAQQQRQWYATYTTPWGEDRPGIATWEPDTQRYAFVPDDGAEPCYPAVTALVLGGNVALVEVQRVADGDLVSKVCRHDGMVTK